MKIYSRLEKEVEKLKKITAVKGPENLLLTETIINLLQSKDLLRLPGRLDIFRELFPAFVHSLGSKKVRAALETLQKAYDLEVVIKGMKFEDEIDWLIRSESKVADELRWLITRLEAWELRELVSLTRSRFISYDNIARTAEFPNLVNGFRMMLSELPERSGLLIKEYKEVIENFRKTGLINEVDFYHIKGEIMEILSNSLKQDYLAAVRAEVGPKSVLIENVMAKTKLTRAGELSRSASFLQIWDGIIAEITDDTLNIFVKFEIKSGRHGYFSGTDQILDTFFNRFTSFGDQLKIIHPSTGKEMIFALDKISKGTVKGVKGLDSGNVLITPLGVSNAMPDTKITSNAFDIDFLPLRISDIEVHAVDFEALVMDLLMAKIKL